MLSPEADGKMAKAGLMPKTPAERKAAERARKRERGLVRFEEWVTPTERDKLRAALARLRKRL